MAGPFRIGIVTDGLEERRRCDGRVEIANGGVGVYIHHLLDSLRAIDSRNEYVLVRYAKAGSDLYPGANGRFRTITLPGTTFYRYARWIDFPYRRLVRSLDLDLIHYPNQFGGGFLPAPMRRVVTLHDLTPLLFPRHHPWRSVVGYTLLLRRSLRTADHVIVDSAATRADVLSCRLTPDARVSVVPLGISPVFCPTTRTAGFSRRYDLPERFILSVGVLEPRKNHRVLIETLRVLHGAGERVGLVIAGRDGWRWKNPMDDPSLAGLRSSVRILRNVPDADLPELYGRAEVFAYPSLYEGFGFPILEAMACGVPVVTSNRSAMPEVGGDAALYADPTDMRSVAARILRLLRDRELRERLAQAGIRRAAEFTWTRTAERTLEVYERVCGRGE